MVAQDVQLGTYETDSLGLCHFVCSGASRVRVSVSCVRNCTTIHQFFKEAKMQRLSL